jgi:hypothetical protein
VRCSGVAPCSSVAPCVSRPPLAAMVLRCRPSLARRHVHEAAACAQALNRTQPTLRPIPPSPLTAQAGDHGMAPAACVFASSRRPCDTREAALQLAGLQLLWEAGACPDQLLDVAGRPCLNRAGGLLNQDKPKRKRQLDPYWEAGGAGNWKRQQAGPKKT